MAPTPRTSGFVYRRGSLTARTFTPRPEIDTTGKPGTSPGLSTVETLETGIKGHRIDLSRLRPPLQAFADDPNEGGDVGHVAIVPVDETGAVDQQLLESWAAYRDQEGEHPLTTIVLEAVVGKNARGPL
jgi:hypothetical protein